jgi:transcriptional regulator with XRE-family HTH domain
MTQLSLGERVGLSRTAITNIECGRQRLLVDQLVHIAYALGVPPSALIPPFNGHRISANTSALEIEAMPTVKRWVASITESPR